MATMSPPRAGTREWVGLAILALPTVLLSMDLTVLYLAVPKLSTDLQPSATQLLWITDIYGFLIAGFLVTMGRLGDRIGRRKLLFIGAVAFGAASVLTAFSTSAEMLILSRALLGIAGSTLMPSTLALLRNMFLNDAQRSVAIGVWMMSFMVGAMIGPLVGGALLENFWWGSVFLLGVPVMVLLLIVGPFLLPEYRSPDPGKLDLLSAVLSLISVLTVIYGIKDIAKHGVTWVALASITVGLLVGYIFVQRQRKLASPLLDLNLFADRAFSSSLVIMVLGACIMMGFNLYIAQYLQMVQGYSPLESGLWTLPMVISMILATMFATTIVRKLRPAYVISLGMLIAAAGFLLLAQVDATGGLAILVVGSVIMSIGLAPAGSLSTDITVRSAPPERAGAASAISETSNEMGGALGLALLGSVGTAVYQNKMAQAIPAEVAPELADAARDTLGGVLAATEQLPSEIANKLLEAGREAFTQGMHTTAMVAIGLVLIAGFLAFTLLRGVPTVQQEEAPANETTGAH